LYPLVILLVSVTLVYFSFRGNQAIRAENQVLKTTLADHDQTVRELLQKTGQFTYDFFGLTYVGNAKEFVDKNILLYGGYEKYLLFFLRDVADNLKDNHLVFLDIGACTGQHSLFMCKHAAAVHSFEPFPPVVQRFRKMVEFNGVRNITIWPVALGSDKGTLPFYAPPQENPAVGSLQQDWYPGPDSRKINVDVLRGDDLPPDVLADIGLIKMDTEGYEKHVVRGFHRTFQDRRPIVVMEVNTGNKDRWTSLDELMQHFPPNYRLLCINQIGAPAGGRYKLGKLDLDFSVPRDSPEAKQPPNVVLYPVEKETLVPTDNLN